GPARRSPGRARPWRDARRRWSGRLGGSCRRWGCAWHDRRRRGRCHRRQLVGEQVREEAQEAQEGEEGEEAPQAEGKRQLQLQLQL
ncbi:hypothetical protein BN1708_019992, partial [Verticillium longisporum]